VNPVAHAEQVEADVVQTVQFVLHGEQIDPFKNPEIQTQVLPTRLNAFEHPVHVEPDDEHVVHGAMQFEHTVPFKNVPDGQLHVDPVNENVLAHAEHVSAFVEHAVQFELHDEQTAPFRNVPVGQTQDVPLNVNPLAHAEHVPASVEQ